MGNSHEHVRLATGSSCPTVGLAADGTRALAAWAQASVQSASALITVPPTLVGTAQALGEVVRLTSTDQSNAVGAMWTATPTRVVDGFQVDFSLQITPAHEVQTEWVGYGDGVAFVIQNDPRGAGTLGGAGQALGYADPQPLGGSSGTGISNSVAVEFDTAGNNSDQFSGTPDPNANHVSVHTRGVEMNSEDEQYSLAATTDIPNLTDGATHAIRIVYVPGTLTVFIDDLDEPRLTVDIELNTLLRLPDDTAWLGITGSTGDGTENHDIADFTTRSSRSISSMREYAVESGDTLWAIAAVELGDPFRWPEIAAASAEISQSDGGRLADPNLIRPGWNPAHPGHHRYTLMSAAQSICCSTCST